MRRIGIDVGGTNTDAVLLEDDRIVHAIKTPTTADVTGASSPRSISWAAIRRWRAPIDAW